MTDNPSFKGYSIVACGTLHQELNHLRDDGFLDADKVLFTAPGLHENLNELKKQLIKQIRTAKNYSNNVIVVYGDTCYLPKEIDELLQEEGGKITRIEANHCVDMLASTEERDKIAEGKKIYWLPPGWFEYRKIVFKNWDVGMANETFPQHDKAIMLDSLGVFEEYSMSSPEKILEFSDWMGIPIEPFKISLDRFGNLLSKCIKENE
jgi:hypothetical protein